MLEFLRCLCNFPLTYVFIDVPHEDRAEETGLAALASLFFLLCVRGRQNVMKRGLRGSCCLWGFSRRSVLVVSLPCGLETLSIKNNWRCKSSSSDGTLYLSQTTNVSCTFLH